MRIGEMMKWIVCHSDCKYLHQKLLPSRIINFLSQRDREMTIPTTVFTKKSGCTILVNLLVFKIVFATIIKFVCSSSAGIWSPEKCYRYTVIKFVAEVQFQILVLEFLKLLHYQYTIIQFVCSCSCNSPHMKWIIRFTRSI